jgi:hypothetical protein
MPKHASSQYRERSRLILETKCEYVFAHRRFQKSDFEDYPITFSSPVIEISVGPFDEGWWNHMNNGIFPMCTTSATVATAIALYMGFKSVGIIGVDLIKHKTCHNMGMIDQSFGKLCNFARENGQELVNLSDKSKLTTVPKWNLDEFIEAYDVKRIS